MIPKIEAEPFIQLLEKLNEQILDIYNQKFEVYRKSDDSPLTKADLLAHQEILAFLGKRFPGIPVISEEMDSVDYESRKDWESFWLVDPLDGTKEFIHRQDDFTVNIALIHQQRPVFGCISIPTRNTIFYTDIHQKKVRKYKNGNEEEVPPPKPMADLPAIRIVNSRFHPSEKLQAYIQIIQNLGKKVEVVTIGSSIKFCALAEGKAEIYPRFVPTREWDTAAGQAILEMTGGTVVDISTQAPLAYNKRSMQNGWFVANAASCLLPKALTIPDVNAL